MQFQQISPPFLLSKRIKTEPSDDFLTQLNQNAQRSILKRLQKTEIEKCEPLKKPKKQINSIDFQAKKNQNIKTKQPSLPYLKRNSKQFYDKWYIPYDQRFISKIAVEKQSYQNPLNFYHNMQEGNIEFDPFDDQIPEELQQNIEYNKRTEILVEMLKGQKMIHEFKKSLDQSQTRVPFFMKKIFQDKQFQNQRLQQNK